MISIPNLLALLIACALLTHILMPAVRRLGVAMGLVDHPSWRRAQRAAVPCSGGLAIYAAVVLTAVTLALTVGLPFSGSAFLALGLAGFGTLVLGVLDDRFGLHAEKKLLGQIVVVTLPMAAGLTLRELSLPFLGTIELGVASGPITLFWYLGFINSLNLIDGLDGLAGGIVVAVLAALALAVAPFDGVGLLFVVAFLGSVLGFLRSNLSSHRIFLGDAGSMLLGLWVAGLTLGLSNASGVIPLVAVCAMAIPILDTSTTILRRRRRHLSVFRADDEHLHHRLLRLGMTPRRAAACLWLATVGACALGICLMGRESAGILLLGAMAAVAIELAYTLPRQGPPSVAEAVSYLLGWRDSLGDNVVQQDMAKIIEMPRYHTAQWSPPTIEADAGEATVEAATVTEKKDVQTGEGPAEPATGTDTESREDVLLAATEENH